MLAYKSTTSLLDAPTIALGARKVAPDRGRSASKHNEAFEFVGASVSLSSQKTVQSYPDVTEGELSRMKHRLVSAPTLAKASARLTIGDFLRMGHGEEKSGGRLKHALLADAFEAVLAAIFFDGGLDAATDFIHRALGEELEGVDPESAAAADYKTMLQERYRRRGGHAAVRSN